MGKSNTVKDEVQLLFEQRMEYIKGHPEEMTELKANYTFHFVNFESGMEPWFDLWKRHK